MSKKINYPSSWKDEINQDRLEYMQDLKKESKQVNIDFWEHHDMLTKEGEGKIPEEDICDEAYRYAKDREAS